MAESKKRPKILIVDDSRDMRKLLRILLGDDYILEEAEDGIEALKKAGPERPDIILLDGNMPVMNGYETCRLLRQNPDTSAIPIIFCTADIKQFLREGIDVDDFIEKPFSVDELCRKIERLL